MNGAGDDGGYLRFFRIDREEMQAEFFAPGELIVDFGFLSDGSIAAVTETAVCFLSADGTLLSEHRLGTRISPPFHSAETLPPLRRRAVSAAARR